MRFFSVTAEKMIAIILLLAFAIATGVPAWRIAFASDSKRMSVPNSQILDLKILSADSKQTIGTTSFTISSDGSKETINGKTTYVDGQRDNEEERIQLINGRLRLEHYEHSFFDAGGAITMLDKLDRASHSGACSRREHGAMQTRTAAFDLPTDTFGGGSQLLIVMASLRQGSHKIDFHAFACVPGPWVFEVNAMVPARAARWPLYPGDLIRLDLRPNLGVGLNLVIAPFLPKTAAWFDPHDNWKYVGGEFNRYFGGPHVFQVLFTPPRFAKSENQ
jgi:hypothetical protein